MEHVGRFTVQCGEASTNPYLKQRLFPNSLRGSAFSWYIGLPANSVQSWAEIEQMFHEHFYRLEPEMTMADLSRLMQKSGETAEAYIARFKKARHRCHVNLPGEDFVKLCQNEMG